MDDITWLGHASFFFSDQNNNRIYYVDPFDLQQANLAKADLLFITHAHHDHLSLNDIKILMKNDTIIIAPPDCLAQIDAENRQKLPVAPNPNYTVKNFTFQTIPAYNVKPDRLSFHPKSNNWVGYVFNLNGKKIYHAGDTDFIPEMHKLEKMKLDVALLPMGGTYTMDVDETIEAANAIGAKTTIPMHYKRLLGEKYKEAEEKLKQGVTNSHILILEELQ